MAVTRALTRPNEREKERERERERDGNARVFAGGKQLARKRLV